MVAESVIYVVGAEGPLGKGLLTVVQGAGYRAVSLETVERYLAIPEKAAHACSLVVSAKPQADAELLRRAMAEQVVPPFILVSEQLPASAAVEVMKTGAEDLLMRPFAAEQLACAMADALGKAKRIARRQAGRAALQNRFRRLTPREKEVMPLVVGGYLNKEAAWVLGIAEITVQVHRGQVMRKMEAESLPDLVRMAAQLHVAPTSRKLLTEPRTSSPYERRRSCLSNPVSAMACAAACI